MKRMMRALELTSRNGLTGPLAFRNKEVKSIARPQLFLALPREIRDLVCAALFESILYEINQRYAESKDPEEDVPLYLSDYVALTRIFYTNHQIYAEAKPLFYKHYYPRLRFHFDISDIKRFMSLISFMGRIGSRHSNFQAKLHFNTEDFFFADRMYAVSLDLKCQLADLSRKWTYVGTEKSKFAQDLLERSIAPRHESKLKTVIDYRERSRDLVLSFQEEVMEYVAGYAGAQTRYTKTCFFCRKGLGMRFGAPSRFPDLAPIDKGVESELVDGVTLRINKPWDTRSENGPGHVEFEGNLARLEWLMELCSAVYYADCHMIPLITSSDLIREWKVAV